MVQISTIIENGEKRFTVQNTPVDRFDKRRSYAQLVLMEEDAYELLSQLMAVLKTEEEKKEDGPENSNP